VLRATRCSIEAKKELIATDFLKQSTPSVGDPGAQIGRSEEGFGRSKEGYGRSKEGYGVDG
jgi:hypothetical protein